MLLLTRQVSERIFIGEDIEILVVNVTRAGKVKLGIVAPRDVAIRRDDMRALALTSVEALDTLDPLPPILTGS